MSGPIPKGTTMIAEKNEYTVLRYDDKELGTFYILKGLGVTDYVFNRAEWDRFAELIAYADLKIRGAIE